MSSIDKLRILVLGYVVRRPLGGGVWPTIQYALGLQRLGHEVYFLEDSEDWGCCYDPSREVTDEDPTYGLRFAARVLQRNELGGRWAYYDAHRATWHGPCAGRIHEICAAADLLINNSGVNPIRPWLAEVPCRVYIDTDPAFEQVRQLTDDFRRQRRAQHNAFFTLGENIPAGTAAVPDDGVPWQATRQPVVLDRWEVTPGPVGGCFTTVMLWDSYQPQAVGEFRYGMKSASFGPYLDLPSMVDARLELAIGGPDVPRQELREHGWSIRHALEPTRDAWTYQEYLRSSKAEFTVAKHGYVVSRCGWFSERSAHYLASGRPVITQDTGFGTWLPVGEGLLTFQSVAAAAAAIRAIDADYPRHCRAARSLVEEFFDANRVLRRLVDLAMRQSAAAPAAAAAPPPAPGQPPVGDT
jgi:hypothetical protein